MRSKAVKALAFAPVFGNIKIDKIYASPLKRAMKTAEKIAAEKGLEIISEDDFREIHFGEWEGKTVPELTEKYGESYTNFIREPHKYGFPGEGSVENVINRIKPGIDRLIAEDEGNVLIVSHGGIIRPVSYTHLARADIVSAEAVERAGLDTVARRLIHRWVRYSVTN